MQKTSLGCYLLESNIQIKCERLSRIADHRQAVLLMWSSGTSYQLYRIRPRIVSNLCGETMREKSVNTKILTYKLR